MLRLCIVGGALQGMESVYLAKKAGYETVVIDRRKGAPALSMCDEPVVMDPVHSARDAMRCMSDCDAVLPACENITLLDKLCRLTEYAEIPLLFDLDAYRTTSSKNLSNDMMRGIGIPLPKEWPGCGFPAVVKPSSMSGSVGVNVVNGPEEAAAAFERIGRMGDDPTAQEFVPGRPVSIEVIGQGVASRPMVTTEIVLDGGYDCKRVYCGPDILSAEREEEFRDIGRRIAEHMGLRGLMDVEAIDTPAGLRVLEIDARMPSQTPAAVLAATGVNILSELVGTRIWGHGGRGPERGFSSYEHLMAKDGALYTTGEKEFSQVVSPQIVAGLFGADEMITDHDPELRTWRGTMINSGRTKEELETKRKECIRRIMDECGLDRLIDSAPEEVR